MATDSLDDRRQRALAAADGAIAALAEKGVTAELIGSLNNDRFGRVSDVDFLVTRCPRRLKYAIESVVEDCLAGLSFDVFYADELSAERLVEMRSGHDVRSFR